MGEINIKYGHFIGLAPTKDIREFQKKTDRQKGESKSERLSLSQIFKGEFENRILNKFNFDEFIKKLNEMGAGRVVLFCVEEKAAACHRSLVAEKIYSKMNYSIRHL